jgi:hypothetical protein
VTGGGVAPDGGVDRAGVLVLHARGRDARTVGALRGVALRPQGLAAGWGRVTQLTSRFPRLLRAGARRVEGSKSIRAASSPLSGTGIRQPAPLIAICEQAGNSPAIVRNSNR